jgi:hypothetical protein
MEVCSAQRRNKSNHESIAPSISSVELEFLELIIADQHSVSWDLPHHKCILLYCKRCAPGCGRDDGPVNAATVSSSAASCARHPLNMCAASHLAPHTETTKCEGGLKITFQQVEQATGVLIYGLGVRTKKAIFMRAVSSCTLSRHESEWMAPCNQRRCRRECWRLSCNCRHEAVVCRTLQHCRDNRCR